jgi:hypothetical protein
VLTVLKRRIVMPASLELVLPGEVVLRARRQNLDGMPTRREATSGLGHHGLGASHHFVAVAGRDEGDPMRGR